MKLKANMGDLLSTHESNRSLVGKLNFLTHTRPDFSFVVQYLSQFHQKPWQAHMKAALHLLRYLKGPSDVGVFFSNSPGFALSAYFDSDRAACPDSQRSVYGVCNTLGDCLIGWKAKKQLVVSLSSAQAEYRTISKVVTELTWVIRLLTDFGISVSIVVPVYYDNQTTIHIARNLIFRARTKHIEVDCHFILTKLGEGLITLHHVPTYVQLTAPHRPCSLLFSAQVGCYITLQIERGIGPTLLQAQSGGPT